MVWHAGLTSCSTAALRSVGYPLRQASPRHTGQPQLAITPWLQYESCSQGPLLGTGGAVSPCFAVGQVSVALCSEAAPDSVSWSRCAWGAALDRPQAPEL